jgi:hypothetical protein
MPEVGIHRSRVERLLGSPGVVERRPRREVDWPIPHAEPADLSALYLACDGLELDDATRLFGRGELRDVTEWLVLEKGLAWSDELVVVGERRDIVVVLDLDVSDQRAGGGVLETGVDDLGLFDRVACDVVGYLCARSGVPDDGTVPPEIAARRAAASADAARLEQELTRPMYPGTERLLASLSLQLGTLWARSGENARALTAFERSVEARVASVGRGAREAERVTAWRAAVHAARSVGASDLVTDCEKRAGA